MSIYCREGGCIAWDDPNNKEIDEKKVRMARKTEMQYIKERRVYTYVDREEVLRRGGKIIKVRWVDTNKGDRSHPNYRLRLVGMEFRIAPDDSLYAATPPPYGSARGSTPVSP